MLPDDPQRNQSIETINAMGSQGMVIMPAGPVTQVFEGQKTVQAGAIYIERLEAAHLSLVATDAGYLVNPLAAPRPQFAPKPRPVLQPPDHVPTLVGRTTELSSLFVTLGAHIFVEVYGPADIGKTALLETAGAQASVETFPDGVLFLRPRRMMVTDLLQELHDTLFCQCRTRAKSHRCAIGA